MLKPNSCLLPTPYPSHFSLLSTFKDRIIPAAAITLQEKRSTLLRLNQVLEQRLVSSPIPLQMRNLKVAF